MFPERLFWEVPFSRAPVRVDSRNMFDCGIARATRRNLSADSKKKSDCNTPEQSRLLARFRKETTLFCVFGPNRAESKRAKEGSIIYENAIAKALEKEQGVRKLIITVLAMLVPFGLWTAGCRQNRQAAFPTTPEMKNIARAPERDYATRPPVIPAAIDREVLHSPDQATDSRILAVMDNSARLSNRSAGPGLFVLPAENAGTLAYGQEPSVPGYYVPSGSPAIQPEPSYYQASAPVPAPSGREFWSKPAAPAPARMYNAQPAPADVSAMMPAASPSPSFEPVMLPEDIPGVFMGGDDASVDSGWIGMKANPAPFTEMPAPITADSFASVSADELNGQLRESKAWRPHGGDGPDLDLVALLTPVKSPPEDGGVAALSDRLSATLEGKGLRQALEPLPTMSASALPPPPELLAESPAAPASPAAPGPLKRSAVDTRDLYRMDIEKTIAARPAPLLEIPEVPPIELLEPVKSTDSAKPADLPLPSELTMDADAVGDVLREIIEAASADDAPRKISLEPSRTAKKHAKFDDIDADVAVPPLRY